VVCTRPIGGYSSLLQTCALALRLPWQVWFAILRIELIMKCPFCRGDNDRVIDSRASDDGYAIRRRRECGTCARRYTTYERIEGAVVKVVKKDGIRVPFDRDKIKRGLEKACWKRPISAAQVEEVVSAIEADIFANFEGEVDSQYLGEQVIQQLKNLDQVAYVRFASVYREFKDVRDFFQELEPMLTDPLHARRFEES